MSHANTGCYAVDRGGFLLSVIFSARIVIRKHDHEARKRSAHSRNGAIDP
jgi:hypothetical protein